MLKSIKSAERSVYLEMYIFEDGVDGYDFVSELSACAKRGVRVVVVVDVFGSYGLSKESVTHLKKAGAEVLFFSFWFRRTHRKILIIDEKEMFLGGVNIGKSYTLWKDLQIRVRGAVVKWGLRSFEKVYIECGGKKLICGPLKRNSLSKRATLWFVEHGIGGKRLALKRQYEEIVQKAEHEITIVTPYFVPPRWFMASIHQALLRGVKVELLVPKTTSHFFEDRINHYYLSVFLRLGVKCYLDKSMNHAKVMLVDGCIGVVGSNNIDQLSFEWNVESGIFFNNIKMVKRLVNIVDDWKFDSDILRAEKMPSFWYDKVIVFIFKSLGLASFM